MMVKCMAAYIHLSSTVYELYSEILVGCSHWNSGKKIGTCTQKTGIMGLPDIEDSLTMG